MVTDIVGIQGLFQHRDQLGIAMAEIVGAAIDVAVDQAAAGNVVNVITFAFPDHEIDAAVAPELGFAGVPISRGVGDDLFFGGILHIAATN